MTAAELDVVAGLDVELEVGLADSLVFQHLDPMLELRRPLVAALHEVTADKSREADKERGHELEGPTQPCSVACRRGVIHHNREPAVFRRSDTELSAL